MSDEEDPSLGDETTIDGQIAPDTTEDEVDEVCEDGQDNGADGPDNGGSEDTPESPQ